jgi:serine protease Do
MRYFLAVLLVLSPWLWSQSCADASDISAASRSVVRVVVYSAADGQRTIVSIGSGVVVAPDKIITNAHVIEQARYDESVTLLVVPSEGGQSYGATLVAALPGKDLALLKVSGDSLVPASFFSGAVPDGSDVFAIGYPASVDIALEQNEADWLRPQTPVKARGSVSSGRSSKSIDSLLHTAPIAPGNSGGPLVDACGRVVGINSFGSVSTDGGAEFYFAVSVRELSAFLGAQGVAFRTVTGDCRSVADLTRAEAEREAAAKAKLDTKARVAAELRQSREGKFRSDAEHAVIGERENHMAFSTLLLVLAAIAGGAAWQFTERRQHDRFKIAAITGGVMFVAAIAIFAARPSFDEVDDRVRTAMTADLKQTPAAAENQATKAGPRRCVIQPERSRITMSDTADVDFSWQPDGCINGRTQYVENGGTWTRSFVPNTEAQVSVVGFSPATQTYRIERYLLGMDAMAQSRKARQRYEVAGCSANPSALEKIDNMNKAVRELLPSSPNEILVFNCSGG